MRFIWYNLSCCAALLLFQSCGNDQVYDQKAKTLDSLSGALNAVLIKFEKSDTLLLNKAIDRFINYRAYIQNNIHDTISKTQADALQLFYKSGSNLVSFKNNRQVLLSRAQLINSQMGKLSEDVKARRIDLEPLNNYVTSEQKETQILLDAIYNQEKMFFAGKEEFKLSLQAVEEFIKEHNNGELPLITQEQDEF